MLRLVIALWEIVGKPKKLSAKSHLLRNFLAIRLPDCRTFWPYEVTSSLHSFLDQHSNWSLHSLIISL